MLSTTASISQIDYVIKLMHEYNEYATSPSLTSWYQFYKIAHSFSQFVCSFE